MSGFMQEFKKFIARGNVIDMAVGVIIGGAFSAIVSSLVDDIINPILGMFGGVDFSNVVIPLKGEAAIRIGSFINAVINFLIMAFILFCIVKAINKMKDAAAKEEEAPKAPTTKVCPYCKSEIAIEATKCPHCTSDLPE